MAMSELKQKVLKHELAEAGFPDAEYRGVPGRMFIDRKNDRMPDINDAGDIHYGTEYNHMAIHTIRPIVDRVNEMVAAWSNARPMPFDNVSQFRKLTEHNNIILAARDDTGHGRGLYFVTWRYDGEQTGVDIGHYTADYDAAKQDFAVRSGLVRRTKVFDKEQAAEIRSAVMYRIENDGDMTISAEEQLRSIAARLTDGYGLTEANPIDFDVPYTRSEAQTSQVINGSLNLGDWVIAAPSDEYGYLLGVVTAIDKLGTPEHDTENSGDDIHVDFTAFEYPSERVAEIEEAFSESYGEPKAFDELPLDDVIMAPDTLIRITELGHDEITRMGNVLENCVAFCNCFPCAAAHQSDLHAALIARIEKNYADYQNSLMGFGKRELIDMAAKIHAMSDAHSYMTCWHRFDEDELQFYMQFENPLEIVGDEWHERNIDTDGVGDLIRYQTDNKDALVDYPLMSAVKASTETTPVEPVNGVFQHTPANPSARKPKRSLEAKLQAAGEKVKAQQTQSNKDKSRKRDERS